MEGSRQDEAGGAPQPAASRYLFPRHPGEVNRLDLQHYAFREAMGAHYFAPIQSPERILDVGTGTGQWCVDMKAEFPRALIVGLDLVLGKPVRDGRYNFIRADVTSGLPFPPETFDLVHQRLLRAGIPVDAWPGSVAELVRVTRPGGWVELMEIGKELTPGGPATSELIGCLNRLAALQGLDPDGRVVLGLDHLLTEAGLNRVTSRRIELPVGEWGGRPGSFLASDMRAMFTRLAPAFEARCSVTQPRKVELVRTALSECEELHSCAVFLCAWGRRPEAATR